MCILCVYVFYLYSMCINLYVCVHNVKNLAFDNNQNTLLNTLDVFLGHERFRREKTFGVFNRIGDVKKFQLKTI